MVGHLLLASLGQQYYAIDALAGGGPKVLWSQELNEPIQTAGLGHPGRIARLSATIRRTGDVGRHVFPGHRPGQPSGVHGRDAVLSAISPLRRGRSAHRRNPVDPAQSPPARPNVRRRRVHLRRRRRKERGRRAAARRRRAFAGHATGAPGRPVENDARPQRARVAPVGRQADSRTVGPLATTDPVGPLSVPAPTPRSIWSTTR